MGSMCSRQPPPSSDDGPSVKRRRRKKTKSRRDLDGEMSEGSTPRSPSVAGNSGQLNGSLSRPTDIPTNDAFDNPFQAELVRSSQSNPEVNSDSGSSASRSPRKPRSIAGDGLENHDVGGKPSPPQVSHQQPPTTFDGTPGTLKEMPLMSPNASFRTGSSGGSSSRLLSLVSSHSPKSSRQGSMSLSGRGSGISNFSIQSRGSNSLSRSPQAVAATWLRKASERTINTHPYLTTNNRGKDIVLYYLRGGKRTVTQDGRTSEIRIIPLGQRQSLRQVELLDAKPSGRGHLFVHPTMNLNHLVLLSNISFFDPYYMEVSSTPLDAPRSPKRQSHSSNGSNSNNSAYADQTARSRVATKVRGELSVACEELVTYVETKHWPQACDLSRRMKDLSLRFGLLQIASACYQVELFAFDAHNLRTMMQECRGGDDIDALIGTMRPIITALFSETKRKSARMCDMTSSSISDRRREGWENLNALLQEFEMVCLYCGHLLLKSLLRDPDLWKTVAPQ